MGKNRGKHSGGRTTFRWAPAVRPLFLGGIASLVPLVASGSDENHRAKYPWVGSSNDAMVSLPATESARVNPLWGVNESDVTHRTKYPWVGGSNESMAALPAAESARYDAASRAHEQQIADDQRMILGAILVEYRNSNVLTLHQGVASASLTLSLALSSCANAVHVNQTGESSTAAVDIAGNLNKVAISQSGAGAVSTLKLTGSGNDVGVSQSAPATVSALSISGTSSTVRVSQSSSGAHHGYTGTVPSGGSIKITQ